MGLVVQPPPAPPCRRMGEKRDIDMNAGDICKNCGGERGLHHYETNQCPVGGREAPIGRKQEWKMTLFEAEDNSAARIAALESDKAKLIEALDKIRMIASCAPHDDEELASQEFTTIMNEARAVLAEVTK